MGDGRWGRSRHEKLGFARFGGAEEARQESPGVDSGLLDPIELVSGDVTGVQHDISQGPDFAAGSSGDIIELSLLLQVQPLETLGNVGHGRHRGALDLVTQPKVPAGGSALKVTVG